MIKNWPKLLLSLGICEGVGLAGSIFTFQAIPNWYANLNKPSFNPPSFAFGPAWLVLYALMGTASYLIWEKGSHRKDVKKALRLFGIHLFFNGIWSILFFGLRSPILGLIDITVLWFLIVILVYKFWKIDNFAGLLLLPYLTWVSFAAILNYYIFILNP